MPALSIVLSASLALAAQASPSPDYRAAYDQALKCFVATSAYSDQASARRSWDAAMRLGQLQNLSNQQLNADLNRTSAYEGVRLARSAEYRTQLLTQCRRLGLAT